MTRSQEGVQGKERSQWKLRELATDFGILPTPGLHPDLLYSPTTTTTNHTIALNAPHTISSFAMDDYLDLTAATDSNAATNGMSFSDMFRQ